jgi:NitT/TauT family transport system substrate-binding protein
MILTEGEHMNRWVAVVVLLVASLAQAAEKVKIQLNWLPEPEFGGIYAARESGEFARNNLDVEIMPGGPNVPVWPQVDRGRVEFGVVGADEVLIANSKGADLVAIYTTYQTYPQGIMVHASRNMASLADVFKSGTLAIEPGLPYTNFLKKKYGFDGVKIVPYAGGITQFLADKDFAQQCFVFSEPVAAKHKGADPKVFLIADSGYNPYTGVVITTHKYLSEHRDVCTAMAKALQAGWRSYLDDPKPANNVMANLNKNMDLQTFADSAEAQKMLVENAETKQHGLGVMTHERWAELARQMEELGVLKHAPDPDSCFVNLIK